MRLVILNMLSCLLFQQVTAQTSIDNALKEIKTNNKSLQSNTRYWEARRAEFRTGLTPYDPQVEYDYLPGSPAEAGTQKDFTVTQRLDFPTTYTRKRTLAKAQIAQTMLQRSAYRQEVLLEAKLLINEIIYLNKRSAEFDRRVVQMEKLNSDYQKKLDKGDVIILDVNKVRLQLHNLKAEQALNSNARQLALTRLTQLNGGIEMSIIDTLFPRIPEVPDFETLDSMIEANDPLIKVYEQEKIIQKRQIAVQKLLNLPKLEAGYHSQGILGQSYKGVHAGITIPLWENRNRVRAAEAQLDYVTANATNHRLEHRHENKRYYEELAVRREYMQQYLDLMTSLNNISLLEKALRYGQITIIQFLQDQGYYYATYDKYLQLEWEYQQAIARLYKFSL